MGNQINQSTWQRGQKLIVSKRNNDVLRGAQDDEEDEGANQASHSKRSKGNKKKIIEEF